MGYTNRIITLKFDELAEPGDQIYVSIRNPRLLPMDHLRPSANLTLDANGRPVDVEAAEADGYAKMAELITDWHVYDGMDDSDDPRPLDLPATPAAVRRLPNTIQQVLFQELEKVANPR
jgi:hypothetical protein